MTLAIGGVGAVLLVVGGWYASRQLIHADAWTLVAIGATAFGAAMMVGAAVLSAATPARISDDVAVLRAALEAAADGDLGLDVPAAASHQLQPAAAAAQRAISALRGTLGTVGSATRESALRAEELASQCSVAHVAAQRTAEQGGSVSEQAGAAMEMARTLQEELSGVAQGIAQVEADLRTRRDHAARLETLGVSAASGLSDASESLDELTSRFATTATELTSLGRAVEDVQEFVALVRKMARQSKLLSLNAAMEAARAGEQGSGFGVVAAEVRRLARSSSEAADRTEKLLRDLLARAEVAQEASRDTLALARRTRESVDRTRTAVTELRALDSPASRAVSDVSPSAALGPTGARLDQLAATLATLAQASRDARVAGSAQVARAQDLIAAAHSLGRSTARAAAALPDVRIDRAMPPASTGSSAPPSAEPVPA
ncbi:MAG: methyl-accepting chemotaxis protein [Gemmatimonadaceae bacterium]|nr:methyl-accepting chemotaxis protein [Gemmatimonadaceae bacterium]